MVEHAAALALGTQADLLGISRRSVYDQPVPPPPEEVARKHRIDARSTDHPFDGSRTITVVIARAGERINRTRVQRSMRALGIAGMAPGPNLHTRASPQRRYSGPKKLHSQEGQGSVE
jgi:putative transposase